MAAKPRDHEKQKYVEKVFHVIGHILSKFHDFSSNGLGDISKLRLGNNNNNKYSCRRQRCRASRFPNFCLMVELVWIRNFLAWDISGLISYAFRVV